MKTELEINEPQRRPASLNVLIVYDNVAAGKRAKELCDRLKQQLAPEAELRIRVWSLSALRLPTFAEAAASQAERAAVLIVAVRGDTTLIPPVQNCLQRCARGIHSVGGTLVAQLHGILKINEELCPACACLRKIAQSVQVRFFSEVIELTDAEPGC